MRWASSAVQVANRRQAAWLSERHWQAFLAALSESKTPEALDAYVALAGQLKVLIPDEPAA